jgi:undecaprenyl-diphosphatase
MDHKLTQLISHAAGQSFPSDHTTLSTAVALGVLFFTRFKKIGGVLLACACAIGFSRIFVGVHYPADIVAGLFTALIGCGLVLVVKKIISSQPSQPMSFSSQK